LTAEVLDEQSASGGWRLGIHAQLPKKRNRRITVGQGDSLLAPSMLSRGA